ncbi:MAG: hypothetical protein KAG64_01690 [Bacteroidales bacterium]|nr:hypothetical protein [Bacteroidales bacterium]
MKISIPFLSILLFLYSCGKDKDPLTPDSIIAGNWDSNFEYYEFPTPIELNPIWEASNWVANADTSFFLHFGQDSIPFRIQIKYINSDSLQVIKDKDSSIIQRLQVYAFDDMGFHFSKKTYYVGLGSTTDMYSVTAYKTGDNIEGNTDEFSFANNIYHRWKPLWEMPIPLQGTINGYDGGSWYSLNNTRYIGFIYNNHLGWFKVDCTDYSHPKFISYAIKK